MHTWHWLLGIFPDPFVIFLYPTLKAYLASWALLSQLSVFFLIFFSFFWGWDTIGLGFCILSFQPRCTLILRLTDLNCGPKCPQIASFVPSKSFLYIMLQRHPMRQICFYFFHFIDEEAESRERLSVDHHTRGKQWFTLLVLASSIFSHRESASVVQHSKLFMEPKWLTMQRAAHNVQQYSWWVPSLCRPGSSIFLTRKCCIPKLWAPTVSRSVYNIMLGPHLVLGKIVL